MGAQRDSDTFGVREGWVVYTKKALQPISGPVLWRDYIVFVMFLVTTRFHDLGGEDDAENDVYRSLGPGLTPLA